MHPWSYKAAKALGIKLPKGGKKKHKNLFGHSDGQTGSNAQFDAMCKDRGIPKPVSEYVFHDTRKWRFDYLFDGWLALEVEGGAWSEGRHTRGKGFVADIEKYNEAVILGYSVLRCTPQQIEDGSIFPTIKRALDAHS